MVERRMQPTKFVEQRAGVAVIWTSGSEKNGG